MPTYFKGQKYSSIKSDLLKRGQLFEDPAFPTIAKSLFYSDKNKGKDVVWKRPKELCRWPKLVAERATTGDLSEGEMGKAWFVSACASLRQNQKLFQIVVPDLKNQEWNEIVKKPTYAGIFHFRIWRYGEWIDVTVDDRLPTKNNKPLFCHSKQGDEFWSALLEKAYAKLFGDYETLYEGQTTDTLIDFTGGVAEKLVLSILAESGDNFQPELANKLKDALSNFALINCSIHCKEEEVGHVTGQGLILGHAYSVTHVHERPGKPLLIGLACLWSEQKWTGAWCDGLEDWKYMNSVELAKLGIKLENRAQFWMSMDDFVKHFTNVDIVHFINTSIISLKKKWNESVFHGEWNISGRNGGSNWNSATFLSNPQYVFDIGIDNEVIVVVDQHDINTSRHQLGIKLNTIGFQIMKVEENRRYRVHINGDLMFKSEYIKSRSVFGRPELKRGRYVLFPTTKDAGDTGRYMVRLFISSSAGARHIASKILAHARELTEDCPVTPCCGKPPLLVTTLTVEGATGLELSQTSSVETIDPYVKIRCEGEKVVSEQLQNTNSPTWNVMATFYRKIPDLKHITVEIWNGNRMIDDFMAEARITIQGNEDGEKEKCDLFGRRNEEDAIQPGNLHIFIKSSNDLAYL